MRKTPRLGKLLSLPPDPDHAQFMPRLARLVLAGVPLHITQRGHNRSVTFHCADDFRLYRATLERASRRAACLIHAYALMSNHIHILTTPQDAGGPAAMMRMLNRVFVGTINKRYGRTGTLWEGRYKSAVIDSDRYLLVCSRYIELNPVRAGIVEEPGEYTWSSFRHNALGAVDPLIDPHPVYLGLGGRAADRQSAYRRLFDDPLAEPVHEVIRLATRRGAVLGDKGLRESRIRRVRDGVSRLPEGDVRPIACE